MIVAVLSWILVMVEQTVEVEWYVALMVLATQVETMVLQVAHVEVEVSQVELVEVMVLLVERQWKAGHVVLQVFVVLMEMQVVCYSVDVLWKAWLLDVAVQAVH